MFRISEQTPTLAEPRFSIFVLVPLNIYNNCWLTRHYVPVISCYVALPHSFAIMSSDATRQKCMATINYNSARIIILN